MRRPQLHTANNSKRWYTFDQKEEQPSPYERTPLVPCLGSTAVFKYAGFVAENLNGLLGTHFLVGAIILPLGISFFTFEQISYLVDVRGGQISPSNLLRYALFVSFFPRVVAGPILRFGEIDPQLTGTHGKAVVGEDLMIGLTIFCFGLAKKTVLADGVAPYAISVFQSAAHGDKVDFSRRGPGFWRTLASYTLFRYGDRRGTMLRHSVSDEFLFSLSGDQHHRVLEALAHHLVAFST